jgi:hypothetical protein
MDDHELAAKLLKDHFTATAALIASHGPPGFPSLSGIDD